jgi:hypothetical protein
MYFFYENTKETLVEVKKIIYFKDRDIILLYS